MSLQVGGLYVIEVINDTLGSLWLYDRVIPPKNNNSYACRGRLYNEDTVVILYINTDKEPFVFTSRGETGYIYHGYINRYIKLKKEKV